MSKAADLLQESRERLNALRERWQNPKNIVQSWRASGVLHVLLVDNTILKGDEAEEALANDAHLKAQKATRSLWSATSETRKDPLEGLDLSGNIPPERIESLRAEIEASVAKKTAPYRKKGRVREVAPTHKPIADWRRLNPAERAVHGAYLDEFKRTMCSPPIGVLKALVGNSFKYSRGVHDHYESLKGVLGHLVGKGYLQRPYPKDKWLFTPALDVDGRPFRLTFVKEETESARISQLENRMRELELEMEKLKPKEGLSL